MSPPGGGNTEVSTWGVGAGASGSGGGAAAGEERPISPIDPQPARRNAAKTIGKTRLIGIQIPFMAGRRPHRFALSEGELQRESGANV